MNESMMQPFNMVNTDPPGTEPAHDMYRYNSTIVNYAVKLTRIRSTYSFFLVAGHMLGPLQITAPKVQIPATVKAIPCSQVLVPPFSSPSVFGSAWHAQGGSTGLLLTDISGNQATATVSLANLPGISSSASITVTLQLLQAYFSRELKEWQYDITFVPTLRLRRLTPANQHRAGHYLDEVKST
jgi:hypothetical protein